MYLFFIDTLEVAFLNIFIIMNESNSSIESSNQTASNLNEVPVKRMGYYAAATAVSLLLILIISNAFKQYPIFSPTINRMRLPGWTAVTNTDLTYTFDLPQRWVWQEVTSSDSAALGVEQSALETAVSLFTMIDDKTEIVLVAHANDDSDTPGFVVVAQNGRMRTLPPDQLITFLNENSDAILSSTVDTTYHGDQANLYTELIQPNNQALLCLQRFTTTPTNGHIIVGCAPRNQFSRYNEDLTTIVNSFQALITD